VEKRIINSEERNGSGGLCDLYSCISGFCHQVAEKYSLRSYYAASSGNFWPTFRDNL
jgi:hypothetical protein